LSASNNNNNNNNANYEMEEKYQFETDISNSLNSIAKIETSHSLVNSSSSSVHKQLTASKKNNSNMIKTSTPNFKPSKIETSSKINTNTNNNNSNKTSNIKWSDEIYLQASQNNDTNNRDPSIHVKLETKALWQQFSSIGTEMIITKCGRFVFIIFLFCSINRLKIDNFFFFFVIYFYF